MKNFQAKRKQRQEIIIPGKFMDLAEFQESFHVDMLLPG